MKKRLQLLCFTLILFAVQRVIGQNDFEIDLRKSLADLNLDGYHIENLCIVLDDTTYIGYAQTGLGNTKTPARFRSGIRAELAAFLLRLGNPSPETKPLTLRINKLYIYELTHTSTEISSVTLNVSFLENSEHGWVELFEAAVSFSHSGMDVTHQHDNNIAHAFQQCFSDFNERMKSGKVRPRVITDSALLINPLSSKRYYTVFAETSYPKAVYCSFYDFRDGFPDTATGFTVDYKMDKEDAKVLSASLKFTDDKDVEAPWGFSDGNQVYLRIGKKYYPMQNQDGQFVSDVAPKDLSSDIATGVMAAGIAGGIIGAAFASGIAAIASTSRGALERGHFRLDFSARTLLPATSPDYLEVRSHLLFFLSTVSAPGLPVCIFVDDVFHAKLQPGEYYDLSLSSGSKEISVTFISPDGNPLIKKYAPALFQTYVYLIRAKKNKSVAVGTTFGDVRRDILLEQSLENTVPRSTISIPPGTCR
jgi:hypothetical protein